ncbi:MAG: hypothetical protein IPG23_24900 [Burkholderiales bacterium]|nr:hypothetical protein [Burkholderiales bacterium]
MLVSGLSSTQSSYANLAAKVDDLSGEVMKLSKKIVDLDQQMVTKEELVGQLDEQRAHLDAEIGAVRNEIHSSLALTGEKITAAAGQLNRIRREIREAKVDMANVTNSRLRSMEYGSLPPSASNLADTGSAFSARFQDSSPRSIFAQ